MGTAPEIVQRAKEQLVPLTGLEPATVSSLMKVEDGWHVNVEMIELRRIPDSSDVLATYEVIVDDQGELLSYRRTRRYCRNEAMEES
ncbi:MAG: hypothetical protein A2Y73_07350 [Chloroflexi bacterium RBG_13_56_8]|nr:MAG: hypothetical protein A2Y73_07350 [Chloroflexi bacterium RBG_13_56_8]